MKKNSKLEIKNYSNCLLCPNKGGLVKKCVTNMIDKKFNLNWVHVFCANYTDEMSYNSTRNYFEGFDSINIKKIYNYNCELCRSRRGVVIKCCVVECEKKFHAYCGILNDLCKEEGQYNNVFKLL